MSNEMIVALISASAVVLAAALGAVGALVGTSRTRLPVQLRRANHLAAALETMEEGSPEQTLARRVHDDLVADWALREADHSYDELITGARSISMTGAVVAIAGFAVLVGATVGVVWQDPTRASTDPLPVWAENAADLGSAAVFLGGFVLLVGAFLYLVGKRGHFRNVKVMRSAHNLRNSVRAMNDAAIKSHRTERRAERATALKDFWTRVSQRLTKRADEERT